MARLAKVSRATVYRHFPGGKDELIRDTVMWETAHVVEGLRETVGAAEDLESVLIGTLTYTSAAVGTHEVLRKVLETEPERILPALISETPWLVDLLAGFLAPAVGGPGGGAGSVNRTARHLSRMVLSLVTAPMGRNLADPVEATAVVREMLLPAVGEGGTTGEG